MSESFSFAMGKQWKWHDVNFCKIRNSLTECTCIQSSARIMRCIYIYKDLLRSNLKFQMQCNIDILYQDDIIYI